LLLQKEEKHDLYEHLIKFVSKKKKTEMNASIEVFAAEVVEELGQGIVRVKLEITNFEDPEHLEVSYCGVNLEHW